ncbi:mCG11748 [Mus musculus]|nr:mCG11748 [Mus musculus]
MKTRKSKQRDIQKKARVSQQAEVTQEKPGATQEEAGATQEEVQPLEQPKRASGLHYSFDTPIPLHEATSSPENSTGMLHQSAPL